MEMVAVVTIAAIKYTLISMATTEIPGCKLWRHDKLCATADMKMFKIWVIFEYCMTGLSQRRKNCFSQFVRVKNAKRRQS